MRLRPKHRHKNSLSNFIAILLFLGIIAVPSEKIFILNLLLILKFNMYLLPFFCFFYCL